MTTEDTIEALNEIVPIHKSRNRIVDGMRNWAKGNARYASAEAHDRATQKNIASGSSGKLLGSIKSSSKTEE
jgi:hypothetical protein